MTKQILFYINSEVFEGEFDVHFMKKISKHVREKNELITQNSCFGIFIITIKKDLFIFEKRRLKKKNEVKKNRSIECIV